MATYAGAPGVMLLSTRVSNPGHVGPRTAMVKLSAPDISDISTQAVIEALETLLPSAA
jgi:hypothetical protein